MKTVLRKIGNSRGILIPAKLLAACGIEDEIELTLDGKRIVIERMHTPRADWFDNYDPENDDDAWADLVETHSETSEWQW